MPLRHHYYAASAVMEPVSAFMQAVGGLLWAVSSATVWPDLLQTVTFMVGAETVLCFFDQVIDLFINRQLAAFAIWLPADSDTASGGKPHYSRASVGGGEFPFPTSFSTCCSLFTVRLFTVTRTTKDFNRKPGLFWYQDRPALFIETRCNMTFNSNSDAGGTNI